MIARRSVLASWLSEHRASFERSRRARGRLAAPVRHFAVAVLIALLIAVFTGSQWYETAVAEGLHQSWVQTFTPQAFLWTTWALLLTAVLFVNQRIDRVRSLIGRIGAHAFAGAIASLARAAVVFAPRIVVTRLARRLEAFGDPRRIVDERQRKVVVEYRCCRPSLG